MLLHIGIVRKIKYPGGQTKNLNLYVCDCGKTIERLETSVKDSENAHCGCKFDFVKNWKYGNQLKKRWNGLQRRTINGKFKRDSSFENGPYKDVTICEEWKNSFKAFYEWSISNGFKPYLHIDRIDSKKGYEPTNCRWVTQQDNNRNGARSKLDTARVREILLLHGIYSNLEIARVYNIDPSTLVNICKGVIWKDVFEKYSTDKNKKRLNPINLLPINANIVPGTINFEDSGYIEKILLGYLVFKDGEKKRLLDIKNEYIIYNQYDKSNKSVKNFFDLLQVNIKKDSMTFDRYLRKKLIHNKENVEAVRIFINKIITKDIRDNYVLRFNNTFKLVLKIP